MTDSIAIPSPRNHSHSKGKQKALNGSGPGSVTPRSNDSPHTPSHMSATFGTSSPESTIVASSPYNTPSSAATDNNDKGTRLSAREKEKMPSRSRQGTESWSTEWQIGERRASLLSSSISKSEHTVVNIGEPDRPRLITCVKASQGFDWNQDIFLPSYISDHDYASDLERRQDPVEDIFITDEEAEMMLPR